MKFEIKKRVLPVAAAVDDLVYRDPNVTGYPNGSALPQDGSNIFSGVQIDASGNPVQLPRILPQETTPNPSFVIPNQPGALPETMTPPFNPNQPAFTVKPPVAPTPLEATQRRYEDAVNAEVKPQGLGKQILFQVLQGINRVATGSNEPIEMLGNYKKRLKVEGIGKELGTLQQQQKIQQDADYNTARTANVYADNERMEAERQDRREAAKERVKASALSKINTLKTYDPTKGAMRKLAEQAGLNPDEIGGWDFRNPIEHSINGVRFRLNRETGKYEQTDLPVDEEKQLVDFTTKDGKKYRVSAKTAATLQTQFDTLGMRQDYDTEKTRQQQEFTLKRDGILSQMRMKEKDHEAAIAAAKIAASAVERDAAAAKAKQTAEDLKQLQSDLNILLKQTPGAKAK